MKSRIAGVALAAVVGACALGGGMQRAEAYAFISGSYQGQTDIDGGIGISQGSFYFSTYDGYLDYTLYTRYDLYLIDPPQDIENTTSGHIKADSYSFTSLGYQGGYQIFELGFRSSVMAGYIDAAYADGVYVPLYYNSIVGDYLIGANAQLQSASFGVTVPLPSSAPMLGAALIALGGSAYARRRFRLQPKVDSRRLYAPNQG